MDVVTDTNIPCGFHGCYGIVSDGVYRFCFCGIKGGTQSISDIKTVFKMKFEELVYDIEKNNWADSQGGGSGNIADLTTEVQAFWSKIFQAIMSEEPVDPSIFVSETLALHSAIKTAKTAEKPIVASVNFEYDDMTVDSDAYNFSFVDMGDTSSVSFRFADTPDASFPEFGVWVVRTDTDDLDIKVVHENSVTFESDNSVKTYRESIFEYSSLPS